MKFTDKDIELCESRLAEHASGKKHRKQIIISGAKAKALFSRLRAAEDKFSYSHLDDSGTISMCLPGCKACLADKKWMKVAGK